MQVCRALCRDLLVAAGGHHVEHVTVLEPVAQIPGLPVGLVGGEPGEWHAGGQYPLEHGDHLPGLGGELHLVGDPGRPAAVSIGSPRFGKVELPINQRVPVPGCIRQEHPDLAVFRPPGRAGVLSLHPS